MLVCAKPEAAQRIPLPAQYWMNSLLHDLLGVACANAVPQKALAHSANTHLEISRVSRLQNAELLS